MSETRKRFEEAKNRRDIHTDVELLKRVYAELKKAGKASDYKNEEEFVSKTKGRFHHMLEGTRSFDDGLLYATEKVLQVPMIYILDGDGQMPKGYVPMGIRYAAYTDKYDDYYDAIINAIDHEIDEYGYSLLDYMVMEDHCPDRKYSPNGLKYYASEDMLPLSAVGEYGYHGDCLMLAKGSFEQLRGAAYETLPLENVLKYADGFHYLSRERVSLGMDDELKESYVRLGEILWKREDVRKAAYKTREYDLSSVNPGLQMDDGEKANKCLFANYLLVGMIEAGFRESIIPFETMNELLLNAIRINEELFERIRGFHLERPRVDKYGFVYDGHTLYGQILLIGNDPSVEIGDDALEAYARFKQRWQSYVDGLSDSSRSRIVGQRLYLGSSPSLMLLDFYKTMNEGKVDCIPTIEFDEQSGRYTIPVLKGKSVSLKGLRDFTLLEKVAKVLAKVDEVSRSSLGKDSVFVLDAYDNAVYADGDSLSGFLVERVCTGHHYDNLAHLMGVSVLLVPSFSYFDYLSEGVAHMLKGYGIKKSDVYKVMDEIGNYFLRQSENEENGGDHNRRKLEKARALWCELYQEDILAQYK